MATKIIRRIGDEPCQEGRPGTFSDGWFSLGGPLRRIIPSLGPLVTFAHSARRPQRRA